MMRTKVNIENPQYQISYKSPIFTIGSCFSDCIGHKLVESKFETLSNPFGVIFNPISIFELLKWSITQATPHQKLFTERDELWLHHQFHSDLRAETKNELNKLLQIELEKARQWLSTTKTLIITLGTAFVHRHTETQTVVANCHKAPSKHFQKELLTQKLIINAFNEIYALLSTDLDIILTVSPVRHTREGIPENMESKSILRTTCGSLSRSYDNVHYFPSYEIMMDELRDYRYYKPDLIHPSEEAEDHIFQKFVNTSLNPEEKHLFQSIKEINTAINHRPFNPTSVSHKKFLTETIRKMKGLSSQVDYSAEIVKLEGLLNS